MMDILMEAGTGLICGILGYLCGKDSRWAFLLLTAASVGAYVWYQTTAVAVVN